MYILNKFIVIMTWKFHITNIAYILDKTRQIKYQYIKSTMKQISREQRKVARKMHCRKQPKECYNENRARGSGIEVVKSLEHGDLMNKNESLDL